VFALAGVALRLPRRPIVAKRMQIGARRCARDRQHGHCRRETARLKACVSLSPGTVELRVSQASAAPNRGGRQPRAERFRAASLMSASCCPMRVCASASASASH